MIKSFKIVSVIIALCLGSVALCLFAAPKTGPAQETSFVSEKKCKKCHIKQHKTWRATKHAKTFECLDAEHQKDPKCLKCHTSGFEMGGFVSVEESGHLLNVQCEQCHGPGSTHFDLMSQLKKDKVEKEEYPKEKKIDRTPTGCTKCHNPHVKHEHVKKK